MCAGRLKTFQNEKNNTAKIQIEGIIRKNLTEECMALCENNTQTDWKYLKSQLLVNIMLYNRLKCVCLGSENR